jgi:hypothetical protein
MATFSCSALKAASAAHLLILKILPVTRFKDPKAAILKLKMLQEAAWFGTIIQKAAEGQVNSHAFSLQPMRGWH